MYVQDPPPPTNLFFFHSWLLSQLKISFLGALAKLQKAIISFVLSVRPSVFMEKLGFHWTDFDEIWYLDLLGKSVSKIQVLLKSNKNDGYFT
jgi:hypothetical protein